ncbi:LAME_0H04434g1_1 [Lachancea meyersii CBS 8951]|uniref:ethanolamine-phosphate cytidylyltransferase n=1 Tax=Lachancea meyersii CBS 8951 TaxID=1266667 RepID=A0A1G4KDX6_9SACH|nr:LAME_0H04434g1_1 [Lachancea meyersii CBS 8951]
MTNDRNRLWIDGCFDFTHHGHAGAILQARSLIPPGTSKSALLCGVHNDNDIAFHKGGKPVMNQSERYAHTRSNRWCSEVIEDAPYVTQPQVLDAHNCQFVVHGDDITTDANGEDCYQQMKDMGRFLVVKRTDGVSTTDIIHRILTGAMATRDSTLCEAHRAVLARYATGADGHGPWCYVFEGRLTEDAIVVRGGYDWDTHNVVYIEGDFDLFHIGHIDQLAQLRERYGAQRRLVVGISTTKDCVMTSLEHVLSVLSCKYVDAVVVEPHTRPETQDAWVLDDPRLKTGQFAYLDKAVILDRIMADRDHYVARNIKKGMSGY